MRIALSEEEIGKLLLRLELAIGRTPTGTEREMLTDCNIIIRHLLSKQGGKQ